MATRIEINTPAEWRSKAGSIHAAAHVLCGPGVEIAIAEDAECVRGAGLDLPSDRVRDEGSQGWTAREDRAYGEHCAELRQRQKVANLLHAAEWSLRVTAALAVARGEKFRLD